MKLMSNFLLRDGKNFYYLHKIIDKPIFVNIIGPDKKI